MRLRDQLFKYIGVDPDLWMGDQDQHFTLGQEKWGGCRAGARRLKELAQAVDRTVQTIASGLYV